MLSTALCALYFTIDLKNKCLLNSEKQNVNYTRSVIKSSTDYILYRQDGQGQHFRPSIAFR